jgi:hypothetical protein
MFKAKGIAQSIVDHFESKFPRERSGKIEFSEAPGQVENFAEGGKLTANARKHIAPHNFALPGGRYPIHDESHARNALARVSQHGTPEEKATVRAKVHAKYPGIEQSHAEGGEIEDSDHMAELASHSQAMHDAMKSGDYEGHARAFKAFLHAHDTHESQLPENVESKPVDYGDVSDEKNSKKVAIAGDEYE